MALAFFDELEGGIISIIDVVAKFGKIPNLDQAFLTRKTVLKLYFLIQYF